MQRYMERFQVSWNVSPFVQENGAARLLSECDEGVLVQTTLSKPESCLKELQQSRERTNGVYIDSSTICRTFQRLDFKQQKIKYIPQSWSEKARLQYMAKIGAYDPSVFIWLDETGWDKHNAVRQYGYALQGLTPRCTSIAAIIGWNSRCIHNRVVLPRYIGVSIYRDIIRHDIIRYTFSAYRLRS